MGRKKRRLTLNWSRYNGSVEQNDLTAPLAPGELPKPKIDMSDVLTLVTRLVSSLILGAMAVFYLTGSNFLFAIILAVVSLLIQLAAIRLIRRMREENTEYIAAVAKQQEAARALKEVGQP